MQSNTASAFVEPLERRDFLSCAAASTGLNHVSAGNHTQITATVTPKAVKKTVKKAGTPTAKNLLFFGNSFTLYNNVPDAVAQLAVAAGNPKPNVFMEAVEGWTLHNHLDKIAADGANNIIQNSLPANAQWDQVVIQELSTRPLNVNTAPANGDVAAFRADSLALFNLVKARTPAVKETLTETWARGAANPMYPAAYTSPSAMQNDLLANYTAASSEVNAINGPGTSTVAKTGEAWRAFNFDPTLYNGPDEYHASPSGSLLEALTVFKTIYNQKAISVPSFKLTTLLNNYGLSPRAFKRLATLADKVL